MNKKPWYHGREIVWRYSFRPIYGRFVVEKSVKVPGQPNHLVSIKPSCGYYGAATIEGRVRHNSLWLKNRDDEKAAELLRNYYKERAANSDLNEAGMYLDRISCISSNRVIVFED